MRGLAALALAIAAAPLLAKDRDQPWRNAALSPDRRAALVLAAMTQDEKLAMVIGAFASEPAGKPDLRPPAEAREGSAGYVPGVARLGIPPLWQADAAMGVATQPTARTVRPAVALPSTLATIASWDEGVARRGGAMIGGEARRYGFNMLLAGGINLTREPRNGRNFEYGGEDPLLAGRMVGAQIAGIQSNGIISTIKHYALNAQQTGQFTLDARIDRAALRQSDLLAFQIAIERGRPGAVMCAYNRVNGDYACENDWLLNQVLKRRWRYPGWVLSDWGAVHSTVAAAKAGLDQESAATFDAMPYFGAPLAQAVAHGLVSPNRLDDMVRRILRSMFAHALIDRPVAIAPIDIAADTTVAQQVAERGAVLLRNRRAALPLRATALRRMVVIGGHADVGVLSGGGSSQVHPAGGNAVPGLHPTAWPGPVIYLPSSPLVALRRLLPDVRIDYLDGSDRQAAARAAAASDAAIVFATQWTAESQDTSLTLPDQQDALIAAVASSARRSIVVLETGGAVLMPWADRVDAILQGWYPGAGGGETLARLLTGVVAPSGRLPITIPRDDRAGRCAPLQDAPTPDVAFVVTYCEGAAVGYKGFDRAGRAPLFAFGHGLSYTRFAFGPPSVVRHGRGVRVSVAVRNIGTRMGAAVPQLYVERVAGGFEAPRRLAGWAKLELPAGETRRATIAVDPRLLATYDAAAERWIIARGRYRFRIGASSRDLGPAVALSLPCMGFSD
ncbi:glycoside hydrolase family 3 protein [Sphingomonas sp. S-NIH.Pt15_0812]|uniref:beta-glucosidase n=1 Tax=Sphingomonas sp. S-NIH.Pt15_0812 TaxID=1920129 RepID=UPI000F7D7AB0|nr:glycoside hydrolase family 3 protein [Sphingomonas sp. S-NIH.Pt15_0812]RSU47200.1 glycosyl hydrolase [Sphingomonas sp. S-NIH.Pt15_0812]